MPVTTDTTIVAQALAEGRALARAAKAGATIPLRQMASDAEVSLNGGLEALKRIEAAEDMVLLRDGEGNVIGQVLASYAKILAEGTLEGFSIGYRCSDTES